MENEPESVINDLIEHDIISEEGDFLRITDEFQNVRDEVREEGTDSSERDEQWTDSINRLSESDDSVDSEIVADAIAIKRRIDGISRESALRIAFSLRQFENPPPTEGVPDGFTPLSKPDIEPFLDINPVSIIYVWREECDPCDSVKDHLEELHRSDVTENIGTGAIYGPDCASYLYENYEVGGAPTTLFFANGQVDSRLIGLHAKEIYESEIEILEDYM